MNKFEIEEWQDRINSLERILMRDLEEEEINFLRTDSVENFLKEVLGFDEEDFRVLVTLQKAISDWCTRPEDDLIDTEWKYSDDMYADNDEVEEDINIFEKDPVLSYRKVVDVLKSIIDSLQEELKKYPVEFDAIDKESELAKRDKALTDCQKKTKAIVPDDMKNDNDGFDLDPNVVEKEDFEMSSNLFNKIELPKSLDKWIKYLTDFDYKAAIRKGVDNAFDGRRDNDHNDQYTIDEIIGCVSDAIKDRVVLVCVSNMIWEVFNKASGIGSMEFDDPEIQSEVFDYILKNKKDYSVISINNKIEIRQNDKA